MSFAQNRHVLSQGYGKQASPIELWYHTHYNSNTRSWATEIAQQKYDAMVRMRSESTLEGSTPPIDDESFERVMSRRSGYAPGFNYGVVPPSSRFACHKACEAQVREADLMAAEAAAQAEQAVKKVAKMRAQAQDAARDAAAVRAAFAEQELRLKALEERMARMDAILAAMQAERSSR
uniref:Uncharacterized protein n=2 Tax=Davidia involucrata TaxID=16924 RepID=A0A5B7AUD9_DAVIN